MPLSESSIPTGKIKKNISGRNKGASFEREISRKLSLWITNKRDPNTLARSIASGARSTTLQKKGVILGECAGDLQALKPEGTAFIDKYFVECKSYDHLQWAGLVVGQPCRALLFYSKAEEQAVIFDKIPMLIAKQNRLPIMVMMPTLAASDLGINTDLFPKYRHISIFPFKFLIEVEYGVSKAVRPRLSKVTSRPRLNRKEESNA